LTLVYRARVDLGAARTAQSIEDVFADWLQHKRLPRDLPVSGARRLPKGQEVYRASHAADGVEALRLSLLDVNKQGRWRAPLPGQQRGDDRARDGADEQGDAERQDFRGS
jgi:hypothetical protein